MGFADHLGFLPADFEALDDQRKARALLSLKAKDARLYRTLLATTLRCAPQQ